MNNALATDAANTKQSTVVIVPLKFPTRWLLQIPPHAVTYKLLQFSRVFFNNKAHVSRLTLRFRYLKAGLLAGTKNTSGRSRGRSTRSIFAWLSYVFKQIMRWKQNSARASCCSRRLPSINVKISAHI
jgi:hypothetical protein